MFVGEPEEAVLQVAALESLDRLSDVPSLTWRGATGIVPHRAHGQFTGFLESPGPAWDLLPLSDYSLPMVNQPYVLVETSRGCPYSCDFCVAPIHQGHKFRERSPKALVDEIERCHRTLGVNFFYLWGDTVTLNVKSFTAFCDELIARQLPIRWFGNARADNLTDPAFVHRLRRAGCWMLALGIETESEDIRKNMVKRLERQKIQAAFKNMRDAGIKSFAFFIFGYPGESAKTLEATTNYAIELDPDFANFYPAVPYPGTDLYDKCVREGWLDPSQAEWSKMEYSYYLLRGNGLDERVVMEAINRAKRRFFLRPSYIGRHLGDVARLAVTKQAIVWQVLSRTLFGARVADIGAGSSHASSPAEMRR
jgi:anaerobic magnesium-protoporphyrin IX monomethyl ester cyclase